MYHNLTDEQKDMRRTLKEFALGEFTPEALDEGLGLGQVPQHIVDKAAKEGYLGLGLKYTGSNCTEGIMLPEMWCMIDPSLGIGLHLRGIQAKIIDIYGTDDQKNEFLNPIIRGETPIAISVTEEEHGSDVTRLDTTIQEGIKILDKGDRYILNGKKKYITNADTSRFMTVLGQSDLKAESKQGMTSLVVDKKHPYHNNGELTITSLGKKIGLHLTTSDEVEFRNYEVPKKNRLGSEGRGFYYFMGFLGVSKPEIAAEALGIAKFAFLHALGHAKDRKQFGEEIINFQKIGFDLGEYLAKIKSMEQLLYHTAWMHDNPPKNDPKYPSLLTSLCKQLIPNESEDIVKGCMDLFGGGSYFEDHPVARAYQDIRITPTYEGTEYMQLSLTQSELKKRGVNYFRDLVF
jgi:alkylation response protein AidB-like acyl-CoA dehydrogenase